MSEITSTIASALASAAATAAAEAAATTAADADSDAPPACEGDNDYDGIIGLRVSAIFVILIGAMFGAVFPTFVKRRGGRTDSPAFKWAFFFAKYFGSGVIIATAFIHLLAPAQEELTDPCLTGPITEYSWVEGIVLMTIFVLFFVELMAMRYARFSPAGVEDDKTLGGGVVADGDVERATKGDLSNSKEGESAVREDSPRSRSGSHVPGEDHFSHSRAHISNDPTTLQRASTANEEDLNVALKDAMDAKRLQRQAEEYAAQLTSIFILEFGVIFHSVLIGLTLAVTGSDEFPTLYVVLVFHQTFEGLGLGSRLALTPWPANRQWTPYLLGVSYAFSTPIAIAIGLGVRETYQPGSATALLVSGCFDSISAGILIYTGLVELMAHEFMFSETMRHEKIGVVLGGVGLMTLGAGLMALLGKWA